MSENGMSYQADNNPLKTRTNSRKLKPSKSFMGNLFKSTDQAVSLFALKNIGPIKVVFSWKTTPKQRMFVSLNS